MQISPFHELQLADNERTTPAVAVVMVKDYGRCLRYRGTTYACPLWLGQLIDGYYVQGVRKAQADMRAAMGVSVNMRGEVGVEG